MLGCANAPWAFADSLPRRGRPAARALEKTVSQTGWPHHPERKRPGGSPAPEAVRPRSQNRGNWGPASLTHPGTPHWQEIPFSSGLLKSGLIQPTPVFLPGESQGRGSLVSCCLWGCTESDMTEVT